MTASASPFTFVSNTTDAAGKRCCCRSAFMEHAMLLKHKTFVLAFTYAWTQVALPLGHQ
jgi:hypothetical protein